MQRVSVRAAVHVTKEAPLSACRTQQHINTQRRGLPLSIQLVYLFRFTLTALCFFQVSGPCRVVLGGWWVIPGS